MHPGSCGAAASAGYRGAKALVGTCSAGEDCQFDLWFTNRGPGAWTGKPTLSDVLPSGATYKSGTAPWTCTQTGGDVTCEHPDATPPVHKVPPPYKPPVHKQPPVKPPKVKQAPPSCPHGYVYKKKARRCVPIRVQQPAAPCPYGTVRLGQLCVRIQVPHGGGGHHGGGGGGHKKKKGGKKKGGHHH